MTRPSRIFRRLSITPDEWLGLKIQMLLVFGISTLSNIGYYGQREWRRVADEHHLQTLLRGWDGLAWYVWLLAAPALFLLVRRLPLKPGRIGRNLVWLTVGCSGVYAIVANLRYLVRLFSGFRWSPDLSQQSDWATYVHTTLYLLPMDFITLTGFVATALAVNYYLRFRQRAAEALQLEVQTAQLQSDLARAELAALRGQLHPHFLFNSFNAVAMLVRQRRNEAAVDVIARLSELLRLAMSRTGAQAIKLKDEVEFIRRYLDIEQVRFGDKLRVEIDLSPEVEAAAVPNLILQPLVENAIKHGVSQAVEPARVSVAARRRGERLAIEILNDGPAEPAPSRPGGIGLANTRARLQRFYRDDFSLELVPLAEGGMRVLLDLPWRRTPSKDSPP